MELHSACRLKPPSIAAHCLAYLDRLSLSPEVRVQIEAALEGTDRLPSGEAMERLHVALAQRQPADLHPVAYASAAARLPKAGSDHQQQRRRLAPPTNRGPMVPHPWGILNPFKRWVHHLEQADSNKHARAAEAAAPDDVVDGPDPQGQWRHRGNIRRTILLALMLAQTAVATSFMSNVLPYQGEKPLEIVTLVLFAILFCWVSAGFWTALAGFLVMLRGGDRFAISRDTAKEGPIDAAARTAIVMPICNEDVGRVIAGLRATYASIAATGELAQFDFFILSDSSDPDICTAELAAWADLCDEFDGFGRIFYRRRQRRVKRKSGNIDDFCRRWGKNYRYMIVLDADSVMSGNCVTTLVRMMEAHPGAGIIQTAPRAAGRETLYARIQQFATAVYGPLFTAGLHYWQLGESHYWGHNAIIRMQPFVRHCALAPLPGRGSLAGDILSHDFVEAALMRRAGWGVWIAYDLDGSFEEMPPNLLDELKRDRRWCHGNLMNFRLFTAPGMHSVHRAVFVTGVMAYLSAPLWFAFLALSTVLLTMHTLVEPQYFVEPRQLFPIWPQWHPGKALALFSATATLLFLPKLLGAILVCVHGAQEFGGRVRVILSTLLEMLFSMLLAPVRMLFHTQFVLAAFLGIGLRWKSPPRHDSQTTWREALAKHGWQALLGMAWCGFVYWLNPSFLLWLLPIAGALILSVPVSVFSSRVTLGKSAKRAKLFLIPEESTPPVELEATYAAANAAPRMPDFIDAVAHPIVNALVCVAGRVRRRPVVARGAQSALLRTALRSGPMALSAQDKDRLLRDPLLLSQLHHDVWSEADIHPAWCAAVAPAPPPSFSQPAA